MIVLKVGCIIFVLVVAGSLFIMTGNKTEFNIVKCGAKSVGYGLIFSTVFWGIVLIATIVSQVIP